MILDCSLVSVDSVTVTGALVGKSMMYRLGFHITMFHSFDENSALSSQKSLGSLLSQSLPYLLFDIESCYIPSNFFSISVSPATVCPTLLYELHGMTYSAFSVLSLASNMSHHASYQVQDRTITQSCRVDLSISLILYSDKSASRYIKDMDGDFLGQIPH